MVNAHVELLLLIRSTCIMSMRKYHTVRYHTLRESGGEVADAAGHSITLGRCPVTADFCDVEGIFVFCISCSRMIIDICVHLERRSCRHATRWSHTRNESRAISGFGISRLMFEGRIPSPLT